MTSISVRTIRHTEKEPPLGETFEDNTTARRKRSMGRPSKVEVYPQWLGI